MSQSERKPKKLKRGPERHELSSNGNFVVCLKMRCVCLIVFYISSFRLCHHHMYTGYQDSTSEPIHIPTQVPRHHPRMQSDLQGGRHPSILQGHADQFVEDCSRQCTYHPDIRTACGTTQRDCKASITIEIFIICSFVLLFFFSDVSILARLL